MNKLFLLITVYLLSSCVTELPTKDMAGITPQLATKSAATQNWNWTAYAVNAEKRDWIIFADITKAEVLKDGKTYIPVYTENILKHVAGQLEWVRFDCNGRYAESISNYENGKPKVVPASKEGDAAFNLMTMVCGAPNELYGIMYNTTSYYLIGYKPTELEQDKDNPNLYNFKLYEYWVNGNVSSYANAQLNCVTQEISGVFKDSQNVMKVLSVDKKQYKHFSNKSCSSMSAKSIDNDKHVKTDQETNMTKSSINAAKQKCEQLGFKSKSEKFGKCVLELTK